MMPYRLLLAAALACVPALGLAQARLVTSAPADGSKVARTNVITLTFNEKIDRATLGADLVMTAMPGMASGHQMRMTAVKTEVAGDGTKVTITADKPFPVGSYELSWRAAGADHDEQSGTVAFDIE